MDYRLDEPSKTDPRKTQKEEMYEKFLNYMKNETNDEEQVEKLKGKDKLKKSVMYNIESSLYQLESYEKMKSRLKYDEQLNEKLEEQLQSVMGHNYEDFEKCQLNVPNGINAQKCFCKAKKNKKDMSEMQDCVQYSEQAFLECWNKIMVQKADEYFKKFAQYYKLY